jgi:hypothetical protein
MKIYKQETVQHVNATVEECWTFSLIQEIFKKLHQKEWVFKSLILIKINVSWPNYSIQSNATLWNYLSWMTLITQVKENSYFIDEQKLDLTVFGTTSISLKQHLLELK